MNIYFIVRIVAIYETIMNEEIGVRPLTVEDVDLFVGAEIQHGQAFATAVCLIIARRYLEKGARLTNY